MWGWTEPRGIHVHGLPVNPTYVGMDRKTVAKRSPARSKPHVCGDGPYAELKALLTEE